MKKKNEPSAQPTPMAQKALYLSHFTPSMMQPETLQQMLVQRQPLIDACYDDVVHSVTTRAKHHYLFVGPRGIGKTHLISLLHYRLSTSEDIRKKGLIAWMREEEWGVTSFFELVLRILRTLDQKSPELGIAARTAPLYELTLKQAEVQGTSLLLEILGDKTLIVLLENLDDLFDQLGDAGQRQFRAFIQNHPQLVLVATTPALFAGVSLQKSPFYGFFDIQALHDFSLEDVVSLLKKIAVERGDSALADFIDTPEGHARIRAVHHLAEGNPRIYVIFAQFLSREALDELVQAVMHTLDELTPYYQARMKELSGQQRKIVEYLVNYRGAAPVKQIAKACFITHQTCSGQLKQLREKRYVRSIEQGRESYYELTEPLMRLCMEVKQQRGEPIGLFVEILRIWYTETELDDWLANESSVDRLDRRYVLRALELMRTSQAADPIFRAQINDLLACVEGAAGLDEIERLIEEITRMVPASEKARQARAIVLLSMLRLVPNLKPPLLLEVDYIAKAYLTNIDKQASLLSKSNAVEKYRHLLIGAINLFHIDDSKAALIFPELVKLMLRFPSHAAVAVIGSILHYEKAERARVIDEIIRFIDPLSTKDSAFKFLRILERVGRSIANWLNTGDEKNLLSLPKEERGLVTALGLKVEKRTL
ncbi:hypothetical protein PMI12_02042 [Variovorax sp. CF313]|uniref:hypothetical protein n=1 Tax=Variovorax sp. CF313 TaxID=1144315 RepID=UPI00027127C7|nr:hypothetical protein [Variovorax sp. CF313]EJL76830.1 hypothetical protein PMI12_02042 [Variovorax sp. CF313]